MDFIGSPSRSLREHRKFGRETNVSAKNRLELSAQAAKSGLPPGKIVGNFGHKIAISELAGAQGFEPRSDGIKTRCLTTWRRPSNTQFFTSANLSVQVTQVKLLEQNFAFEIKCFRI